MNFSRITTKIIYALQSIPYNYIGLLSACLTLFQKQILFICLKYQWIISLLRRLLSFHSFSSNSWITVCDANFHKMLVTSCRSVLLKKTTIQSHVTDQLTSNTFSTPDYEQHGVSYKKQELFCTSRAEHKCLHL